MPNYTREPPKEVQLPVRLPLVGLQNQRASDPEIDSRLVNGFIEVGADQILRIIKRPGLAVLYDFNTRTGLGAFGRFSIFFRSAVNPSPNTFLYQDGLLLESWRTDDDSPYTSEIVSKPFGFSDTTRLFHNSTYVFTYDADSGKIVIPLSGAVVGPLSAGLTNASPIVAIVTDDLTRFASVTGVGIPADTLIESIDGPGQITLTNDATVTSTEDLTFTLAGPGESALLPGVGDLNTAAYLFNSRRQIWGSEPGNPWQWNPLNSIVAYSDQSAAVGIANQLSYLVAYKSESVEFFLDRGVSPGSPLARAENLQLEVGSSSGRTICKLDDSIFWTSSTESGLRSVWQLRQGKAQEVAWPSVKRLLVTLDPLYAISFSIAGHRFYLVTIGDGTSTFTLAYDQTSNFWSYWQALGETYFPFVSATRVNSQVRLQHETNGRIYELSEDTLTDEGDAFDMDIYPPEFDGGSRLSKYLSKMYVIADQVADSTLLVRVNDDNQMAGDWSNFREIDLSVSRPRLDDCGSFYKRSFHFRHPWPTRCRLEAVELDMQLGTL